MVQRTFTRNTGKYPFDETPAVDEQTAKGIVRDIFNGIWDMEHGTEVVRVADNFSPSAHRVADSFLIRERSLSSYCEVGV